MTKSALIGFNLQGRRALVTGSGVGLGARIHACAGQLLAKMEGEILLGELARRAKLRHSEPTCEAL
jgi:hypothetical protein